MLLTASENLPESLQLVSNCLEARDSQVNATGGSVAFVRFAGHDKLYLEASRPTVVPVQLDKALSCHQTYALVEACLDSALPEGVEVSPISCVFYDVDIDTHQIVLSNCSTYTAQLQNGVVVVQLTPVVVTESISQIETTNRLALSLDLSSIDFSRHDQEQLNNLV